MQATSSQHTNQLIKRTAKDSLVYLPSLVIPALVGIILIRILTTTFTHEEYGYYNVVLTTIGLIKVFSVVWLSQSVMRFFLSYKNNGKTPEFFTTLLISSGVSALTVALAAIFLNSLFFKPKISIELYWLLNLGIAATIFISLFEIFIMIYRAELRPGKYSAYWIFYIVIKHLVGLLLIIVCKMRVEGIYWAFLIIPIFMFLSIFIDLKLIRNLKIANLSFPLLKEFRKYGIPLAFSNLSFWMLSLSDRYLIELFRNSSEVGLYSVSYAISEKIIAFSFLFLILAATPIIMDNWEKHGKETTQILIRELSRYYLLLLTPLLIILLSLPEQIFLLFADKKFIEGAKVLPWISAGTFLLGLTQYVIKGFELAKKSKDIAAIALFAGVTNIILNLILIPRFGYFGASIACFAAYFVYLVSSTMIVRKYLPWLIPVHSILRITCAAIITGLGLYFVKTCFYLNTITFLLFSLISVATFYFILIILGEIRLSEIGRLIHFLKK